MDCPSEENLIRMKLSGMAGIKKLEFDLSRRVLNIFHSTEPCLIENSLSDLNLGSRLIQTIKTDQIEFEETSNQKRLLWTVLLINFAFFLLEMTTGLISRSMGLVADSLDMLADSFVYGLSLFAVGGAMARKKKIALIAGYFQVILAIIGFVEVVRRFFGSSSIPDFSHMIIVSVLALIANGFCLLLLKRSESTEAHMQASMIFTSNDVIINLGVIVAGILVFISNSNIPDLIIGAIVFILVFQGARRILKLGQ